MFRFLLEGSLGEILAPVTGAANQLNLAIQHHRNDEVNSIIVRDNVDLSKNSESGYGPLHVACRYNNRYVFDLCLSRGVHVDVIDSTRNSPLHYAAKYGHLDLCRALVEKGGSVVLRNQQNQTPYDISEGHHNIRQYLLPLQLQAERQSAQDSFSFAPSAHGYSAAASGGGQVSGGYFVGQPAGSYPTDSPVTPPVTYNVPGSIPIPSPPISGSSSSTHVGVPPAPSSGTVQTGGPPQLFAPAPLNLGRTNSNSGDNLAGNVPTGSGVAPLGLGLSVPSQSDQQLSLNTPPVTPPVVVANGASPVVSNASNPPPPVAVSSTPTTGERTWNTPLIRQTSNGNSRIIQPDGFHTSASDPTLQAKYGHRKEVINIAPPPTGPIGMTTGGVYSAGNVGSAPPAGPPQYSMFTGGAGVPSGGVGYNRYIPYDPNVPTSSMPQTAVPLQSQPHAMAPPANPGMFGFSSNTSATLPMYGQPAPPGAVPRPGAGYPGTTPVYQMPPQSPISAPPQANGPYPPAPHQSRSQVGINIFNPATDVATDVVTFDAMSKSVM